MRFSSHITYFHLKRKRKKKENMIFFFTNSLTKSLRQLFHSIWTAPSILIFQTSLHKNHHLSALSSSPSARNAWTDEGLVNLDMAFMSYFNFVPLEVKALTGQYQLHEMSENLLQLMRVAKSACILSVQIPLVLAVLLQTDCCAAEQPGSVPHTPFCHFFHVRGWVNYFTWLRFSVLCQCSTHINTMFTNKISTLIIYNSYLIKKIIWYTQ